MLTPRVSVSAISLTKQGPVLCLSIRVKRLFEDIALHKYMPCWKLRWVALG